ncbi:hypothetical protein [Erythrobacter sp. F6033]|uniref:hypothetical protein n=1 Tax=Erythrobacter sp. F6033 TaxID=2926401 RepID=UPI001FF268C9|nr:hypothetical protein [Erythrobacter sp. F6033]MCK0127979.1 hypothetical protein [Erythrobacter sp. F6033]
MLTLTTPFEFLAAGGIIAAVLVIGYIALGRVEKGNAAIAAALSGGFLAYSVGTIAQDGLLPVWTNHTTNMWGVQVWWDLLFAVGIALFFIAPRARKVGMNVPLWSLAVVATASIALLAMCARLFWLENAAASDTKTASS